MTEVNHIYFDTNFLRRLIGIPKDSAHRGWQEFFFHTLNKKFIPFTCLCSSLQFLELIGIVPPPRPQLGTLIPPNWRKLDGKTIGNIISDRTGQIIEQAQEYYAKQNVLATSELISRSELQAAKYTSSNQFARLLAKETFQRYRAQTGFDEMLYQALALDHLQQQVLYEPACEVTPIVHMTVLKDFLGVFSQGYNVALFRLLRNLFVCTEPEIFGSGRPTLVPLDGREELVDTEYLHFALLGLIEDGLNIPVTVFTCDSPEEVRTRIKIARYIYDLFTNDKLISVLPRCNVVLPALRTGQIVCCSLRIPRIEDIVVVTDLNFEIDMPILPLNHEVL